jgi:hypothetical protein
MLKKTTGALLLFRRRWASFILAAVLALAIPALTAQNQCVWTGVEKVVAIGDLHGDYENFVKILRGTGIVDDRLNWAAGKTHLVQMGDIMDRGPSKDDLPNARDILDLIVRLEEEARAAGGRVHQLIGNHEEMNILGISFDYPEYVTVSQFKSFLPPDYRETKEREFKKKAKAGLDIDQLWKDLMKNSDARRQYTITFDDLYGRRIAQQNVAIKINDTVFVHGGFNEKYSAMGLENINNLYSQEFQRFFEGELTGQPEILFAPEGPLWNRDLALQDEALYLPIVQNVLANLQAARIVVAHTPTVDWSKMSRFGGRVWVIDTGISHYFSDIGGHLSALIIDKGNISVWGDNHEQKDDRNIGRAQCLSDGDYGRLRLMRPARVS